MSDKQDPTRNTSAQLIRLKEKILRVWEDRVRKNLQNADNQGTLVLRNALPLFMDTLASSLSPGERQHDRLDAAATEVGREHGQQRATLTEYDLRSMLLEYSHLREVIIGLLEEVCRPSRSECAIIHHEVDRAIAEAGAEFARIQSFNQQKYVENLEMERELRETFVSTMTHDLRNPLSAAQTAAQLILRHPDQVGTVQTFAARIVDTVKRADLMIRDLLDANRIQAGQHLPLHVEEVDLRQLAKTALDELSTIHGNRFFLEASGPILGFWCPEGLRRSIENLANNAVKYGYPDEPISVGLQQNAETTLIRVHNRGQTLSAEDRSLLFKKFGRTQAAQTSGKRGWGLGLTIVKGVAETHHGSVRVDSEIEAGTTFTIELPNDARPYQDEINKAG